MRLVKKKDLTPVLMSSPKQGSKRVSKKRGARKDVEMMKVEDVKPLTSEDI